MKLKEVVELGGAHVVVLGGQLDALSAPTLRRKLDMEILRGHERLIVDLGDVGFIDSTGLGVLVGRLRTLHHRGGWLRIVSRDERILRAFRITGVDEVLGIYPSVDEAVAA